MRFDLSRFVGPPGSRSSHVWSAILYFVVVLLAIRFAVLGTHEWPLSVVPYAIAAYFAFRGATASVAAIKAGG